MQPPVAPAPDPSVGADAPPAVLSCAPVVLTRRADFLRAASARRAPTPGFTLQGRQRGDTGGMRVGFTCSKKLGNAVARNRAKRRLREVARLTLTLHGHPGWDYVLVGRPGATATRDFAAMLEDMQAALARLHGPAK